MLAALQENAERKRTIQFKPDRIGKLVDIQAKLKQGQRHRLRALGKKTQSQSHGTDLDSPRRKGLD